MLRNSSARKGFEEELWRLVPTLVGELKTPQWIPTARAASRSYKICTASLGSVCCALLNQRGAFEALPHSGPGRDPLTAGRVFR